MREKVTVPAIQARKCGPKIKMVTAYDAPSARIADRAGADMILVGDTLGHLGLTPQSIHVMGGYRVQGKRAEAARELVTDAHALVAAGVFAIVLEGVPDVLAQIVTQEVPVPTIGIGAGPHCDGQVLVYHDVLGLYNGRVPKFVRQYAHLANIATEALQGFFADVQAGTFPSDAESYHMDEESARTLRILMRNEE